MPRTLTDLLPLYTQRAPAELYVMDAGCWPRGAGSMCVGQASGLWSADDLMRMEVGEPLGESPIHGAYERWPLLLDGQTIGELRDDGAGMTIHIDSAIDESETDDDEEREATVAIHVWERWTKNGLRLDEDAIQQTRKSVADAVANTYRPGITDGEWYDAAIARLGGA